MNAAKPLRPDRFEKIIQAKDDVGAPYKQEPSVEYITIKQEMQRHEKQRVADYVVNQYIENLHSVAIDAGSTLQKIVEQMLDTRRFLSILTNNMTAFMQNSKRGAVSANEFILTGGKYVALFDALLGNETLTSFELFNPNVVIIGVSGLIAEKGFFCHGSDEVKVKELLFNKEADTILIPVDHSKLGRSDSYLFGTTGKFAKRGGTKCIVVTAPPLPPVPKNGSPTQAEQAHYERQSRKYEGMIERLKAAGVEVDQVPPTNVDRTCPIGVPAITPGPDGR